MPAPPVPAAEAARQRAQRRRLRRRVIGVIYGIPLLLLACALYLYLGPKPPPPPAVLPVTPQRAAQATQRIDAVRQALTEPAPPEAPPAPTPGGKDTRQTAPASGPLPPVRHVRGPQGEDLVTLQLSEADLNAFLSGNDKLKATLEAKGVHAVSVELTPPSGIILHANATLKGLTDNALVAATLSPDPQTAVRLNVTDARFGRLPPPAVRAAVDRIAGQVLANPHRPLSLTVRRVEVRGTDLILTGVENRRNAAK
ncbi:MAG: hypothetical protein JO250_00455 [Armatimonadetes bacterium]|nr:hypothetical protein [Armatimonadota bacterium]